MGIQGDSVSGRLAALNESIEKLRRLLYSTIEDADGRLDDAQTHEISNRLDALIAQFLRIRERLQGDDGCESCDEGNPGSRSERGGHHEAIRVDESRDHKFPGRC
ncbi:MAG: aspartyl-phosphate phosphatase Spo0E family protein [Firmicutes bacterium]|nr:aspartyl-phosphate phosphatase Spo0E family protein [Bacillota bacterium]